MVGAWSGAEAAQQVAQSISIDGVAAALPVSNGHMQGVPAGVSDVEAAAAGRTERREMEGVPVEGVTAGDGTAFGREPQEGTFEKFMAQVVQPGLPRPPGSS
jgi:hypothetical protein